MNQSTGQIRITQANVTKFQEKMRDLEKLSVNASEIVAVSRVKIDAVKENITDNINALAALEALIKETITNSSKKKESAALYLTDASKDFGGLEGQNVALKTAKEDLQAKNRLTQTEHREVLPVLSSARGHVGRLEGEANRLDQMFKPTRNAAAAGKKAANVYGDIVEEVDDAKAALQNTTVLLDEITAVTTNVGGNVRESVQNSEMLSGKADEAKINASKLRGIVENNQNIGAGIREQNSRTEQGTVQN